MNIWNEIKEAIKYTYYIHVPLSNSKKEKFIKKTKERIPTYKQLLERQFNISLGDIEVKDVNQFSLDHNLNSLEKTIDKYIQRENKFPSNFHMNMLYFTYTPICVMKESLIHLIDLWIQPEARHYNSTIYISFNLGTRLTHTSLEHREEEIDKIASHELGHDVWHKLNGTETGVIVGRDWNEGFATYLEKKLIKRVMNKDIDIKYRSRHYREGLKKVESIVAKYGEDILKEIPSRWEEFEKELQDSKITQ